MYKEPKQPADILKYLYDNKQPELANCLLTMIQDKGYVDGQLQGYVDGQLQYLEAHNKGIV